MRIGVTGAFGFLGANLVSSLIAREPLIGEIVAFSSRKSRNPLFDPALTTVVPLDVLDGEDVQRKTRGLDALFHFAGKVSFARRERRATWDVNVLGARNVFEAALENRIFRVVYVSSINVLGACSADRLIADESNDVYAPEARNPNSFHSSRQALAAVDSSAAGNYSFLEKVRVAYFDSKLASFELARRYHRERGLPVVIVMPGTAVGPGDIHYDISELIERVFTNRLAATFPGASSFVHSKDFAEGASLAWQKGRTGESYIISGRDEDNLSYRDFMRLAAGVARDQGRKVREDFVVMPRWLSLTAARLLEAAAPGSKLGSTLGTALILSGSMVHRFSSAKARGELGYAPRRTLEQSIADCYEFLCAAREEGVIGRPRQGTERSPQTARFYH
jgi:nucleoside-diphosphate-sugar epimerase